MVKISSKSEVFDFSGGQKTPIRGLTIIESNWNFWNLPYLVANTCGLNFIQIGDIWIIRAGQKPLIRGVTCDLRCPFWNLSELFQSKVVWKFGLYWLSLSRVIMSTNKHIKKIKQNHRRSSEQYPWEYSFRAGKKCLECRCEKQASHPSFSAIPSCFHSVDSVRK